MYEQHRWSAAFFHEYVNERAGHAVVTENLVGGFARNVEVAVGAERDALGFLGATAGCEHADEFAGRGVKKQHLAAAGAAHVQIARTEEQFERIVDTGGEHVDEFAGRGVVAQHVVGLAAVNVKVAVGAESQPLRALKPATRCEDIDESARRRVVAEDLAGLAAADIKVPVGPEHQSRGIEQPAA